MRWLELRNVSFGPVTVFQESTYQPDTTWRWMGSAAMDGSGNLAVGFSASSASIFPQIRYAGRLATDPLNTLAQGEATLFAGTGSQTGTGSRWGDYSALTVDPVDDCTFWYTTEYYSTTSQFNWRTRIGTFKFPQCRRTSAPSLSITKTADAASVPSGSPIGFTVTVTNSGSGRATSLSVSDTLPGGTGINWSIVTASTPLVIGAPNQTLTFAPASLGARFQVRALTSSATRRASRAALQQHRDVRQQNGGSGRRVRPASS